MANIVDSGAKAGPSEVENLVNGRQVSRAAGVSRGFVALSKWEASSSSTRTAGVPGCGYGSGNKKGIRRKGSRTNAEPWRVQATVSTLAFLIWAYAVQGQIFAPVYSSGRLLVGGCKAAFRRGRLRTRRSKNSEGEC
jgi:hypothetical protein